MPPGALLNAQRMLEAAYPCEGGCCSHMRPRSTNGCCAGSHLITSIYQPGITSRYPGPSWISVSRSMSFRLMITRDGPSVGVQVIIQFVRGSLEWIKCDNFRHGRSVHNGNKTIGYMLRDHRNGMRVVGGSNTLAPIKYLHMASNGQGFPCNAVLCSDSCLCSKKGLSW
jgi:hypothetical protein